MSPIVYLDGDFVPKEEARISVFDHGYLYGDGVFEGIRAYSGRVFRLDEHVERRPTNGPLVRQAAGDFFPVQSLHPVEMLGRGARLVALERPDEMPLQGRQRADLGQRVLHVILAEGLLARGQRFAHALDAVPLGDCQQSHSRALSDARFHNLQVVCNCCHNSLIKRRKTLRGTGRDCNGSD